MQNNLKRIEYDEIKNLVKKYTKTYIGKNLLDEMLPDYNKDRVISNLEKTNCAFSLINSFQSIPIDYFDNIDVFIKTLDSGSGLSAKALLEIAKVLKMSEDVHVLKILLFNCKFTIITEKYREKPRKKVK